MAKILSELSTTCAQAVSTGGQKHVGERPQVVHRLRRVITRIITPNGQPTIYPHLLPRESTLFTTRKNQHSSLLPTQLYPQSTPPITTITIFI